MNVSDYKTAFTLMNFVYLKLYTHHCHLDFDLLDKNSNVIIPSAFHLLLLNNRSFKRYVTLPPTLVTVRNVSNMAPPSFTLRNLWRTPPSPSPLLIENVGNNLRYISKRYFSTQLLWFYGYFANGYSVNSTEVCKEIHDHSDNSDVIAILKTEHMYLLKKKKT